MRNVTHHNWVHDFVLREKFSVKSFNCLLLINLHISCDKTGIRKSKDVRLSMNAECTCVLIVVLKVGRSYSHILTFSEPSKLKIEDLAEPYFIAFINHSYLTWIVIYFKDLNYLHLQIKVIILIFIISASNFSHIYQSSNIFIAKNYHDIWENKV